MSRGSDQRPELGPNRDVYSTTVAMPTVQVENIFYMFILFLDQVLLVTRSLGDLIRIIWDNGCPYWSSRSQDQYVQPESHIIRIRSPSDRITNLSPRSLHFFEVSCQ